MNIKSYIQDIFSISNQNQFEALCFKAFDFQYKNNPVYRKYVNLCKKNQNKIDEIMDIPFLPIEFFKNHRIITGKSQEQITFLSSGTTGSVQSKHYVADLDIYRSSFLKGFQLFYGNIQEFVILALLPNYLERSGSSLVFMVEELIRQTNSPHSGFYLYNHTDLLEKIDFLQSSSKKVLLIGVSYALLDLPVVKREVFKGVWIMETGGMKGKRKEMTKKELHTALCEKFGVGEIHSEYGMTELLSQAYSKGKGIFQTPPWMKILIRDTYDPYSYHPAGKSGGINVIDLANIYSCPFIETKDIGKLYHNNTFEVLGRFDNSDIRGCNLLVN
ncbi:MAG: acyltransferase [Bacteroidales bacterium]|nr:acyltransferase [Bacteroidales bacterium]